ncbi:hypothetical protein PQR01_05710 [Paraburkholderia rhynchosiae]|uniref:Uncharacterized protein n=2 Tax=Paraburkholderia TaxID=1822464 RepID=A0ACC7N7Q9_9BURK
MVASLPNKWRYLDKKSYLNATNIFDDFGVLPIAGVLETSPLNMDTLFIRASIPGREPDGEQPQRRRDGRTILTISPP